MNSVVISDQYQVLTNMHDSVIVFGIGMKKPDRGTPALKPYFGVILIIAPMSSAVCRTENFCTVYTD